MDSSEPKAPAAQVTRRYDRVAWLYDVYNWPMEAAVGRMRNRLLAQARGNTLEIGVGTGRNLAHYPEGVRLTAMDISPRMLARAERRARKKARSARLEVGDVEALLYARDSFDTVTATCVFCSVPDPVTGLAECARVVKPDGRVLLLEHVRPRNRALGKLSDLLSRVTRRAFGFNLNRRTEDNIRSAGMEIVSVRRLGIWREIVATRAGDLS